MNFSLLEGLLEPIFFLISLGIVDTRAAGGNGVPAVCQELHRYPSEPLLSRYEEFA